MKVILLQDVKSVGKRGQIVELKDGYANNCIIKKNLGKEATGKNLNDLKLQIAHEEKVAAEKLAQAQELGKKIEASEVTVGIKVGTGGRSFGSVSSKEIAAAVKEQLELEIDKKKIQMKSDIKSVGEFHVGIKLHPKVTAELTVKVIEK